MKNTDAKMATQVTEQIWTYMSHAVWGQLDSKARSYVLKHLWDHTGQNSGVRLEQIKALIEREMRTQR